MAKGFQSVNLLKPRSILIDELVDWALNVGRLLIIVTEIVAFSMFVYRFTLDRQIIDLRDKINQERQIVSLFQDREQTFRNLQTKLNLTSDLLVKQKQQQDFLSSVIAPVPADSSLSSVSIATDSANITISSQNLASLKSYIEELKKNKNFEGVDIPSVDSNPSTAQITLGLLIKLKHK